MNLFAKLASSAALACVVFGLSAPARADDDITKHLISNPNVGSYVIYGTETNKKIKDPAVQGGSAVEVSATGVGPIYAAAGQVDVNQKVTAGDHIVCAVWLKGKAADGTSAVTVHARLQLNAAPYPATGETDFTLTDQWKMYTLEVDSDKDYDKDKLVFVMHLNGAKQTVDLGPAFVLNMTRTY